MQLRDKTAVITGASRGLGAGIARVFSEQGMNLALCARGEAALPEGERVVSERVDVTDGDAVERFAARAAERFGRIDLWINNAGVLAPIGPLRDLEGAEVRNHLDINVMGVFYGSRAFVRHVRERDGEGVLINISSGASRKAYAGWSAYCAGKAAVDLITESVAVEEADRGVRAHAIAPGVIDTSMQELIREQTPETFPEVERFRQMKRDESFSTSEHVARELLAVAFDPAREPETVRLDLRPGR